MFRSIKGKLMAAFGAILAILLTLSAFISFSLFGIQDAAQEQVRRARDEYNAVSLKNYIGILYSNQAQLIIKRDPEVEGEYRANKEELTRLLGEVERAADNDEKRKWVSELKVHAEDYVGFFDEAMAILRNAEKRSPKDQAEHFAVVDDDTDMVRLRMFSLTNRLIKMDREESQAATDQMANVIKQTLISLLAATLLAIAVSFGIATIFSGRLTRALKQMADIAEAIAAHDFNQNVEVKSSDELGQMAKSFQKMVDNMRQEMAIATRIQTALLPKDLEIDQYELTMEMVTATQVGGDLIDYLPHADGRFWLAVGDVTGHGLTPGLVMMMAQTINTTLVMADPSVSPSKALALLNRTLHQNVQGRLGNDNYMTLQLIQHVGDGEFVAAGMHLDLLIHRAETGLVERLDVPGFWTGLLPDVAGMTEDVRFQLAPGDLLLLYTDGLIEAKDANEEQYDMDRLQQALARYAHLSVEEIQARILEEVRAWMHEQLDDISLIVLRRQPVGAGLEATVPQASARTVEAGA